MSGSVDLNFASKGTAQVLRDQQMLKDGGKAMAALYKQENREMAQLGRDVSRIFNQTRSDAEKLQATAAKLRDAVANTKLPDLERAKAAEALASIEEQIQNVDEAGKNVDGTLTNAFGAGKTALLGSFATVAGGVAATVAGSIKLITRELQAAQDLADKSASTQLNVAASRNVLIRNATGASEEDIQRIILQNQALALETGVKEEILNQARGAALSASSGDEEASLSSVRTAAKFLADRPADIAGYAGTLLDLSKVSGSKNATVNLGLQSYVGGLGRIEDAAAQAKNIPPALIGATGFGFSSAEAGSLLAAISAASGDKEGATSGTALIALGEKLEAYQGNRDPSKVTKAQKALAEARRAASAAAGRDLSDTSRARSLKDAENELAELRRNGADPSDIAQQEETVRRRRADRDKETADQARRVQESRQKVAQAQAELKAAQDRQAKAVDLSGMTTGQKLQTLRANPELALEFFGDGEGFEKKSKIPIRSLLTDRSSQAAQLYDQFLAKFPSSQKQLAAEGQAMLDRFKANTLEGRASASRSLDVFIEQQRLKQPGDLSQEEIAKVQEALRLSGSSATGADLRLKFNRFVDGRSTLSRDEAASVIDSYATQVANPTQVYGGGPVGGTYTREASEAEKESAKALRDLADLIREGNVERKKQTQQLQNSGGIPVTGG